ncbi:MAG: HEAT repeat domain-containing protein [Deltaproteobacteria bacterium]|nr:HEAT repeat domain-containing protein [Deltaproteobacteria bacterium]
MDAKVVVIILSANKSHYKMLSFHEKGDSVYVTDPRTSMLGGRPNINRIWAEDFSGKLKSRIKQLLNDIKRKNLRIRAQAAEELVKVNDDLQLLIDYLKDKDASVRIKTINQLMGRQLVGRQADSVIEPLIIVLEKDADLHVRSWAARALGEIGDIRAVTPLIAALKDLEGVAERALREIKDPRKVEPLIAALADEDATIRKNIIYILESTEDKRAVEPLISILKRDDNPSVRECTARALGRIGDPRAVEPLIAVLNDKNVITRGNAAEALGMLGDPRAVASMVAALKDEDRYVRRNAVKALGRINCLFW